MEEAMGGDETSSYQKFWTAFRDYCEAQQTTLRLGKPSSKYFYKTSNIGSSAIRINAWISAPQHNVICELLIEGPDNSAIYRALQRQRDAIEAETGELKWGKLRKNYSIQKIHHGSDSIAPKSWLEVHRWLKEQCELFQRVFTDRVLVAKQAAEDEAES